jgi:hypothetical protein
MFSPCFLFTSFSSKDPELKNNQRRAARSPAYFWIEVGEDPEAAGKEAEEDGQHPGPRTNPLFLIPA